MPKVHGSALLAKIVRLSVRVTSVARLRASLASGCWCRAVTVKPVPFLINREKLEEPNGSECCLALLGESVRIDGAGMARVYYAVASHLAVGIL